MGLGFPKIWVTLSWGPFLGSYYLGYYVRVPYFSKLPQNVKIEVDADGDMTAPLQAIVDSCPRPR